MGALAFDGSQYGSPVGYYTYLVADDLWCWSDVVYEMHGYAPQAVPATTELMLQHKHPDDMARAFEVLEKAISDGLPFSCYHRIIDAKNHVRSVLSVGRGVKGPDGKVEQVTGFFVDLTEVRRAETQAEVESALVQIAQTRSVIDQAKGMLMVATGCDAEDAFGILRKYSSHKNVKLNDLARRLVEASTSQPHPHDHTCRETVMGILDDVEDFSHRPAS
jgi:hypothetical protein